MTHSRYCCCYCDVCGVCAPVAHYRQRRCRSPWIPCADCLSPRRRHQQDPAEGPEPASPPDKAGAVDAAPGDDAVPLPASLRWLHKGTRLTARRCDPRLAPPHHLCLQCHHPKVIPSSSSRNCPTWSPDHQLYPLGLLALGQVRAGVPLGSQRNAVQQLHPMGIADRRRQSPVPVS